MFSAQPRGRPGHATLRIMFRSLEASVRILWTCAPHCSRASLRAPSRKSCRWYTAATPEIVPDWWLEFYRRHGAKSQPGHPGHAGPSQIMKRHPVTPESSSICRLATEPRKGLIPRMEKTKGPRRSCAAAQPSTGRTGGRRAPWHSWSLILAASKLAGAFHSSHVRPATSSRRCPVRAKIQRCRRRVHSSSELRG